MPSAPHSTQAGPAYTPAGPARPSRFTGMRTTVPSVVLFTNMAVPRALKAIPFAPSGSPEGCTTPHGPGPVVPFNSGLADQAVTDPLREMR